MALWWYIGKSGVLRCARAVSDDHARQLGQSGWIKPGGFEDWQANGQRVCLPDVFKAEMRQKRKSPPAARHPLTGFFK